MKGPFGLLLIGGGIILIVGLFTGKITFPGGAAGAGLTNPLTNNNVPNIKTNNPVIVKPTTSGGKKTCPAGYVLMADGTCHIAGIIAGK